MPVWLSKKGYACVDSMFNLVHAFVAANNSLQTALVVVA